MFQILIISLFIYLVILDFNYFLFLKKFTPLFPSKPPLKIEVMSSPLFFENLAGDYIYVYLIYICMIGYIYIYIYLLFCGIYQNSPAQPSLAHRWNSNRGPFESHCANLPISKRRKIIYEK